MFSVPKVFQRKSEDFHRTFSGLARKNYSATFQTAFGSKAILEKRKHESSSSPYCITRECLNGARENRSGICISWKAAQNLAQSFLDHLLWMILVQFGVLAVQKYFCPKKEYNVHTNPKDNFFFVFETYQ